ncbi:response regulator [Kamptonema formosum]|uniref:response regulator n=1 Tax=Kamptonema formosum TaxID=331992 RepID=UPI00036C3C0F|nr:response regulator [Oscillatoria sp. PCC 10802]
MTSTSIRESNTTPPVKLVASPAKALQNIVAKKLTGRLTIGDPSDSSIFWRVYAGNGQVHFATSGMGQRERLAYLLQWYYPELEPLPEKEFHSDYEAVCYYWQAGQLSLPQVRKLLFWLTQEAFTQLLALPQAPLKFDKTVGLDPLLMSVPLKQTILPAKAFIGEWVRLRSEISSPFQRPFIKDFERLSKFLWQQVRDVTFIKSLLKVLSHNVSIYEASYLLKTDTLGLATLLQPAVRAGIASISPYQEPPSDRRPIVACIDDSKTAQRNVKLILEASGYRVLGLTEPAKALTALARHKPALILLDINMPEINGYELCRMLRQSEQLHDIPIVMLTGRDGMVDKLRARMVGATDYLTKPFQAQQLIAVVHDSLHPAGLEVKTTCAGA